MDTLTWKLLRQFRRDPLATAFLELDRRGIERREASYEMLFDRAASTAAYLHSRGLAGRSVLLQMPQGLDFIAGFYGCLLAGCPAVPRRIQNGTQRDHLTAVLRAADIAAVLTVAEQRTALPEETLAQLRIQTICLEEVANMCSDWRPPLQTDADMAIIQFTSGTTSAPKGVVVSRGALAHNSESIRCAFGFVPGQTVVSWLPFTHDMGLIGHLVQPVYSGLRSVFMPPAAFAGNPAVWLKTIARYGARCSGAPNFAYRTCCDRIAPDALSEFDLSCWEIAYCGAERIEPHTIERFIRRFSRFGLRPDSIYPCYGLAESTLYVTGRHGLKTHTLTPRGTACVSVGAADAGAQVLIVDPQLQQQCADETIGEVWVKSESGATGYCNDAAATAATFEFKCGTQRGFIRTGDLGYRAASELYLVGRIKDVIKVRGIAVAAEDVELTIGEIVSAAGRCLHACAVIDVPDDAGERIIALIEAEPSLQAMFSDIRGGVHRATGLLLDRIVVLDRGTLPKTPSGKVQRRSCRQLLADADACCPASGAPVHPGA